jgi:hypothetical protein
VCFEGMATEKNEEEAAFKITESKFGYLLYGVKL